ncbi:nucleoside hydrolase [Candidatus Poribacteria bacterium]|nr:nucleoside hydrolase [Candidatus Poribacteria bacterium]
MSTTPKVPIILDTDIGDDIDDTWALTMMLKSPELDVKMVMTDYGKVTYRTRLVARMLEVAERTDIPVGMGIPLHGGEGGQARWVANYELASYPGIIYEDGVGALIDTIMNAPEPITLICIGPLPNIAAALEREPKIAENARFVGMHGSVRRGYENSNQISAEWNVRANPEACRKVFTAPWEITITPLDTCGIVHLRGEKYRAVRDCEQPLTRALMDNYRMWLGDRVEQAEKQSSTLFDTVAIYLALSEELLVMEKLSIRITDDGYTVIDDKGKVINCAVEWRDLGAFEAFLVERLTS